MESEWGWRVISHCALLTPPLLHMLRFKASQAGSRTFAFKFSSKSPLGCREQLCTLQASRCQEWAVSESGELPLSIALSVTEHVSTGSIVLMGPRDLCGAVAGPAVGCVSSALSLNATADSTVADYGQSIKILTQFMGMGAVFHAAVVSVP